MYIIMYHYVRSIAKSRYPGIKGLELEFFRQQLEFLRSGGYQFVCMEDVLDGNIKKNSVLLTFDDGYIDHYTNVFPFLHREGIPGFFSMPGKIIREKKVLDVNKIHFILASAPVEKIKAMVFERLDYYRGAEFDIPLNRELYGTLAKASRFDSGDVIFIKRLLQAELTERLRNMITEELFQEFVGLCEDAFVDELYMNMDQVRMMKREGMEFGIHGYDHYWMNRLKKEELREDIGAALNVFGDVVNGGRWVCCYPYGSYSDEVINQVLEMGAVAGLSTDVGTYIPGEHDIFRIPRLDTNDFPPKSGEYKKY